MQSNRVLGHFIYNEGYLICMNNPRTDCISCPKVIFENDAIHLENESAGRTYNNFDSYDCLQVFQKLRTSMEVISLSDNCTPVRTMEGGT